MVLGSIEVADEGFYTPSSVPGSSNSSLVSSKAPFLCDIDELVFRNLRGIIHPSQPNTERIAIITACIKLSPFLTSLSSSSLSC